MKAALIFIGGCIVMCLSGQANALLCTMDYNPVCGKTQPKACLSLDCAIHDQTYSNKCMMESDGAEFLYQGECKTELPEPTDNKYYVGDKNKCMIIRYRCDEGYSYFSDNIGCGCEKEAVSPEMKGKIDTALDKFFQRLHAKNYSQNKINTALSKLSMSLQHMRESKPKLRDIINYTLQKLDSY